MTHLNPYCLTQHIQVLQNYTAHLSQQWETFYSVHSGVCVKFTKKFILFYFYLVVGFFFRRCKVSKEVMRKGEVDV